jgi:hypothetical protein
MSSSTADLAKLITYETEKWSKVVRALNIKLWQVDFLTLLRPEMMLLQPLEQLPLSANDSRGGSQKRSSCSSFIGVSSQCPKVGRKLCHALCAIGSA